MSLISRCALAIVVLGLAAGTAHAQPSRNEIVVTGSGLGQLCYHLARDLSMGKMTAYDVAPMTGSNIRPTPVEVCKMAIEEELLNGVELAGTYNNRGVINFIEKRYSAAASDYREALRQVPSLSVTQVNMGAALIAQKKFKDAMEALNKGIAMNPPILDQAHYNRAIVHEEMGDARGAYLDYLKASELNPTWEEPKKHLARFTVQKKTAAAR